MCDASDIRGYDRRRSDLSYAPLLIKQDTPNIEKETLKHSILNISIKININIPATSLNIVYIIMGYC
tara:strand:+ start:202 stop:402 length:201 start_codon:yes stop_codon:yes gene_type:complete